MASVVWLFWNDHLERYLCEHNQNTLSPERVEEDLEAWEHGKGVGRYFLCNDCWSKADPTYDASSSTAPPCAPPYAEGRWAIVVLETGEVISEGDQVIDPERVRFLAVTELQNQEKGLRKAPARIMGAQEEGAMAKFGLFQEGGTKPLNEYEGDYMQQDKEFVYIKKKSGNPSVADDQVAAIRLREGTSVKKIG